MSLTPSKQAILYSLHANLTLGQLKNEHFTDPEATLNAPDVIQLRQRMESHHITAITSNMPEYPEKFFHSKTPPYLIYAMGNLSLLQQKTLGIVGPREMSPYAEKILEAFFQQAHQLPLTTISGLARGVDHKCHQLSLQHNIPTIAILGGGLRRYLKSNAKKLIFHIVEQGGLVLSEFKLDFQPTTRSFPQRNRLIAALSDVLFLPEAREGSGSLITANFALQMKKDIFVAPNQLFSPNGKGSNQLLSTGKVQLLSNFDQILEKFGTTTGHYTRIGYEKSTKEHDQPPIPLNDHEQQLLSRIKKFHQQDISLRSGEVNRDFGTLLSELTLLEMKGIIEQASPGCYVVR